MTVPRRGEVWLVDLGLAAKIRPCLVLSVPVADEDRTLVTAIPHTTSLRGTRFEVPAGTLSQEWRIRCTGHSHGAHRASYTVSGQSDARAISRRSEWRMFVARHQNRFLTLQHCNFAIEPPVCAGSQGMDALVPSFPRPESQV